MTAENLLDLDPPPRSRVVVVIPYYNGSAFIKRSLDSVYAQTLRADEVVVVNDGSDSDHREFLMELLPQYAGLLMVEKENGGQGSARNAGVKASNSPYICFLDQDDFFLPNHIEDLLSAIPEEEKMFGVVYGDMSEAEGDGARIRSAFIKDMSSHPKRDVRDMLRTDMFILPSASVVSRTAFEAVNGFDAQFTGYEDDDLFLRIFRKGFSNHFLDKPVTVWCIHTGSTTFSVRMLRSRFRYFQKLVASFPDQPSRGYFYLRDFLIPRFGPLFIHDAIQAKGARSEYEVELLKILSDYREIVSQSSVVTARYKLKLAILMHVLRYVPRVYIRRIYSVARLFGFRRLRRLLS